MIHALCIEIRTERYDIAVHRLIRLQPLKDLLAVVQNAGALADRHRRL